MPFEVEGLRELDRKLRTLAPAIQDKVLRSATRAGMKKVFDQAKVTVPVGTLAHRTYKGRLVAPGFASRNLRLITTKLRNGSVSAIIGVRKEAFYILQFIERGTSKYAAHPWLGPAFRARAADAVEAIKEQLKKKIDQVAKS